VYYAATYAFVKPSAERCPICAQTRSGKRPTAAAAEYPGI